MTRVCSKFFDTTPDLNIIRELRFSMKSANPWSMDAPELLDFPGTD